MNCIIFISIRQFYAICPHKGANAEKMTALEEHLLLFWKALSTWALYGVYLGCSGYCVLSCHFDRNLQPFILQIGGISHSHFARINARNGKGLEHICCDGRAFLAVWPFGQSPAFIGHFACFWIRNNKGDEGIASFTALCDLLFL